MSTCLAHSWNLPCYRCAQDARHETARLERIWALGHFSAVIRSQKPIVPSDPKPVKRAFLLPEIDPVTRQATGRVREWREVE